MMTEARLDGGIVRVTHKLPDGVKGLRFRKNHFYVELEDDDGGKVHMPGQAVLLVACLDCSQKFLVFINTEPHTCPHCAGTRTRAQWGKLQPAFIPEGESDFKMPPQPKLEEKK